MSGGRGRSLLFVLFAGAAFSVASPVARWARPTDPLVIAFGRLAVAAVVLSALDGRELVSHFAALTRRARAMVMLAGVVLAAHFACFLWGLDHTSLPAAVSLVSLEPVSVVLTAWVLFRIAPTAAELVGVALATAGAVLVARGAGEGEHRLVGDLVVLGAVLLYGLYLAIARALASALPPRSYAALVYAAATIVMLPSLASPSAIASVSAKSLVAILALGLVPTVLGHTAVQTASRSLPPSVVALVSPMETLGGIAIGAAWMGARPSADELGGAVVILLGTVVAILGPRRATR